ncbi:methyltransferase family protein [Caproicibacter fermentans]|uniref:Isoprenylcysteine carboxylmethyltransferase family protein n=1 Tax=Caproicibacter fermentans TaxID=2576756 RepID=A0A7G8T7T7_9FIRM|nr:isoprenylcysteine carboxylmethyltransferase family protein [Caproicibacter fermentans]QNK39678.1 isoprenylcysteine carboxylmethyltransferase family protein [Caproicibacter fermentans]
MGDPSKFISAAEYFWFNSAFGLLCCSEALIWLFTSSRWARHDERPERRDATLWLIIFAWWGGIVVSFGLRSKGVSPTVQSLLLPHAFYFVGMAFLVGGILLRCVSVWTLKRAFTLNVQTTDDQHLITKGPYRLIRNPAYTGSILSLLGIALCLRSVFAPVPVLILCAVCYGLRIRKEERALSDQFGEEFEAYKQHTWRLFPGII